MKYGTKHIKGALRVMSRPGLLCSGRHCHGEAVIDWADDETKLSIHGRCSGAVNVQAMTSEQKKPLDGSMWGRFRKWKHVILPPFAAVALYVFEGDVKESFLAFAVMIAGVVAALAYVVEEVVWNVKGSGRPCIHCGHRVPMKSFRVRNSCPHCHEQL